MRTGNHTLKRRALWATAACTLLMSGASAKERLPADGPAVIMFWAPWCAPCRQELGDYATLSRAAPVPLIVVALDTGREELALLEGIPADRLRIARGTSVGNLARWSPGTVGLPLTLGIDKDGNRCAAHSTRLDIQALARLIDACKFKR